MYVRNVQSCVHVGVHVEVTTEESSQPVSGAKSSTSSTGDRDEDDENQPTLSSEQLARRPSFKSVGIVQIVCMKDM